MAGLFEHKKRQIEEHITQAVQGAQIDETANEDELFVIQKHLIDKLDWPRVASDYTERWNHEFIRTERSLSTYQTNALKKISVFAQRHKELLLRLFSEGNGEKLE